MFEILFEILHQFLFVAYIKTQSFKPQLTYDEEKEFITKYHNGDKEARNKLIEHNLRLVAHIAKKYEGGRDLSEDLISIGTIGLIKGIDNFQIDKSTRLSTYCARCIENEILMHLRTNKKIALDVSLNEVLGVDKDGSEMTLLDIIPYEQPEIIDQVTKNQQLDKLYIYFDALTSREKDILIKRYGLFNQPVYTQKEIAKALKISRSYVSRLEKRALIKLLKLYLKD